MDVIQKPMPQGQHSRLRASDSNQHVHRGAANCPGVTRLRCTFGGRSIVPDIAVFIGNGFPQMTMVLLLTALMLTQLDD